MDMIIIIIVILITALVITYFITTKSPPKTKQSIPAGVGEPCIAFVNTVKQNRKRFKLKHNDDRETGLFSSKIVIHEIFFKDLLLNLEWKVNVRTLIELRCEPNYDWKYEKWTFSGFPDWLNEAEKKYIFLELKEFYESLQKRKDKRSELLQARRKREYKKAQDKARQEYIQHYCK